MFTPAVAEQSFVLRHVVRFEELAASDRFAAATPDLVEAVLEGVGDFAVGVWAPLARIGDKVGARWTPDGVVMPEGYSAAYQAYVEAGWGTITAPEAHGGQGMPYTLGAAIFETLGTSNMSFGLCPMLTVAAIDALHQHGSDAQQSLYLPKLATGDWTGTMCLTEPQAGSDVGALRTRAEPRDDGTWSIKGTKVFITFGEHDLADNIVHLVLARTPDAPPGAKGVSLFLVPRYRVNADGSLGEENDVRAVSIEHKLGIHASPTCVLSFGDGGECIGELIGPECAGMRTMFTMMNNARLNVGGQGVQAAEAATQRAVAYARERVQSARAGSASRESVAIIEHPDVRRMLLRMKALTQAARALIYYAGGMADRAALGDQAAQARLELLTPLAKAYGTDIGIEVANLGIQVHGGMGFIEETGAAQHLRDVRITAIYEGTNGIQAADLVARKLGLEGGETLTRLIADMRAEAEQPGLQALIEACEEVARHVASSEIEERLAASYPLMTMLSVAVAGWLMELQGRAAEGDSAFLRMKRAACRFYGEQVVPEAIGLMAAAMAPAELLYSVRAEEFAA